MPWLKPSQVEKPAFFWCILQTETRGLVKSDKAKKDKKIKENRVEGDRKAEELACVVRLVFENVGSSVNAQTTFVLLLVANVHHAEENLLENVPVAREDLPLRHAPMIRGDGNKHTEEGDRRAA